MTKKSENPKVKILVGYHKPAVLIKNEILTPVHLGRALNLCDEWLNEFAIGDNTGDNISFKNYHYAEMTGIYWAWKNLEKLGNPDFIGFFHYRRLLDLTNIGDIRPFYELFLDQIEHSNIIHKLSLEEDKIKEIVSDYDIITRKKENLLDWSSFTIKEHYGAVHHMEHLLCAERVIQEKFNQYYIPWVDYLNGSYGYFTNVFIMKREIFKEYCSFVFGVLSNVEKNINLYDRSLNFYSNKMRWAGFLGERLTSVFIDHQSNLGRKIEEFPCAFLLRNNQKRIYEYDTHDLTSYSNIVKQKHNAKREENLESPIVSVCIAAYNVGKYIVKCLNSVVGQTLKNIEIIVVNDGSTDDTMEKILYFKKIDSRIKLINQINSGLGVVRNVGIKHARGKYIHFLDGDDYIEKNFLQVMVEKAEESQAEIVISNHYSFDENTYKIIGKSMFPYTLLDDKKELNISSTPDLMLLPCHVWDKIFKKEAIQDIAFPSTTTGEDIVFWYRVLFGAKKIAVVNQHLVYYRINTQSIQTQKKFIYGVFENVKELKNDIEKQNQIIQKYFEIFKEVLVSHMMYRARVILNNDRNFRKDFFYLSKNIFNNDINLNDKFSSDRRSWYHIDNAMINLIKNSSFFVFNYYRYYKHSKTIIKNSLLLFCFVFKKEKRMLHLKRVRNAYYRLING